MPARGNKMPLAINCDMGESFGLYKMGDDEGMMPFITIANVACGFHASDPTVMARTVRLANRPADQPGFRSHSRETPAESAGPRLETQRNCDSASPTTGHRPAGQR